jgi:hypothetical protein
MKRQFFFLLALFFTTTAVTIASQKATRMDIQMEHNASSRTEMPVDMSTLFNLDIFHQMDIRKPKMEEDGKHLAFHFERIRKMKKGCRFCCSLCKLFLGLIHLLLLLMMFTHLFH